MFFFSLFRKPLGFSSRDLILRAFKIAFKEKQARNLDRILQLRYGAYTTFERLKIGKATENCVQIA